MDLIKPLIEHCLYPIMEKKNGNRIMSNIKELTASQSLSKETLVRLQHEKLKKLLLESIRSVPAYRAYSHLEDEINEDAFSALRKFPILHKSDFQDDPDPYLSDSASKSDLILNRTGGSTGEPVKFYIDRHTVEYYEAARWRGLSWWGISPGSRSVMIWGNPLELDRLKQKKHMLKERWLKNRIVIPAYSIKPELIEDYLKTISSYKPEYIYGYASALYAFSLLIKGLFPVKLKAVVSTAETLHDYQREAIGSAFSCPVVNEYGAKDGGILAYQCKHGSMHISCENAVIEIVDPMTQERLPNGKCGIVLVTDLNNFPMPRLRYRLGDTAALSDRTCGCGMGLPVLDTVEGRETDIFITPAGVRIHGSVFNHLAVNTDAIKRFQIIQNSPSDAELSIILNENHDEREVAQFIDDVEKLLPQTTVRTRMVDDIPVSGSGKLRYAIRRFDAFTV